MRALCAPVPGGQFAALCRSPGVLGALHSLHGLRAWLPAGRLEQWRVGPPGAIPAGGDAASVPSRRGREQIAPPNGCCAARCRCPVAFLRLRGARQGCLCARRRNAPRRRGKTCLHCRGIRMSPPSTYVCPRYRRTYVVAVDVRMSSLSMYVCRHCRCTYVVIVDIRTS